MRVAVLILCHKNLKQINSFIETMKGSIFDFYIHVDLKSNINKEELKQNGVFILPDEKRIAVRWGDLSQIDATMALLKEAFNKKYDYYWLCSGQDFPIKKISYIEKYFQENNEYEYINLCDSFNITGHFNCYDKRNSLFYPRFITGTSVVQRILKRLYVEITGGYNRQTLLRRKNSTNLKFYFGSQWWCLSNSCISWIFNYLEQNPNYYKYFKNCHTQDESFFQTLVMNSPYCKNQHDSLHYIDWSEGNNSPKILTVKDIVLAQKSEFLMARKIDSQENPEIMELLKTIQKG